MLTAKRKHHYVVAGLSRFAQATVGQPDAQEDAVPTPQPEVLLNGSPSRNPTEAERSVIQAAEQGVRQAESDMQWRGPRHRVLSIEGLLVDGIDPEATRIAAEEATKALIQS